MGKGATVAVGFVEVSSHRTAILSICFNVQFFDFFIIAAVATQRAPVSSEVYLFSRCVPADSVPAR
jgi:hypothetical protein